jgi:hypothetical protein
MPMDRVFAQTKLIAIGNASFSSSVKGVTGDSIDGGKPGEDAGSRLAVDFERDGWHGS